MCEPVRQMSIYCDLCADKLTVPKPPSGAAAAAAGGGSDVGKSPCPMEVQTECAAGTVIEHPTTASSPPSTSPSATSTSSPPTPTPITTTSSSSSSPSTSKESPSQSPQPAVVSPPANKSKILQEYQNIIADLKTRIANLEAKDKEKHAI